MHRERSRRIVETKQAVLLLLFTALALVILSPSSARGQFADELILALEHTDELLAPPDLVAQFAEELAAIRQAHPIVADIHARPSMVPGSLMIRLSDDAWALYHDGLYTELEELNEQYGIESIHALTIIPVLIMDFVLPYNPPVLAAIYAELEGVVYAETDGVMGDGDDISTDGAGFYRFKLGWGDCPSGCMYSHYWEFSVSGETVTVLSDYGAVETNATSWGAVKSLYR